MQLDLFQPITLESIRDARIDDLEKKLENVRRGLFSRLHDQSKLIISLQQDVDFLRCKLKEMQEGTKEEKIRRIK